jgi:hypothetical protein
LVGENSKGVVLNGFDIVKRFKNPFNYLYLVMKISRVNPQDTNKQGVLVGVLLIALIGVSAVFSVIGIVSLTTNSNLVGDSSTGTTFNDDPNVYYEFENNELWNSIFLATENRLSWDTSISYPISTGGGSYLYFQKNTDTEEVLANKLGITIEDMYFSNGTAKILFDSRNEYVYFVYKNPFDGSWYVRIYNTIASYEPIVKETLISIVHFGVDPNPKP